MMKLLGLVLARGGSKRVPGKNIRDLGGRPLIAWTLEAAHKSGVLMEVLVSTDDEQIAKVAKAWGGFVPWFRPKEFATDNSPSIEATLHALDWAELELGRIDGVMLLQPTSPFRRPESIVAAAALFKQHECRPVVSFSPTSVVPEWCFRKTENGIAPVLGWEKVYNRSQDFTFTFQLNGAIYIATPDTLRTEMSFLTTDTVPYIMLDKKETLDIDTQSDWRKAEQLLVIRE